MDLNFRTRGRRARAAAGLAVAAVATVGAVGLLSSCGQSSHTSAGAAGDITPGPGQHQMAGMPGAAGAGQGSAPSAPSMPGMSMPMSPPSTAAPVVPANGHTVAIRNFAFSPATLKVKAGTKVTWTNEDTDAHTVTSSGAGGPLHSAALATHGSYSYTFTKPGTYAYLCTIHPFMTATVEVTR